MFKSATSIVSALQEFEVTNNNREQNNRSVQAVARIWLPSKGCCYFNSSNLSAEDSQELLAKVAEQAANSTDNNNVLFGCRVGKYRNVHVVSKRTPDPNNEQRNVSNLWVLLDPSLELSKAELEQFAEASALPSTQADFDASVAGLVDRSQSRRIERRFGEHTEPALQWTRQIVAVSVLVTIAFVLWFVFNRTPQLPETSKVPENKPMRHMVFDSRWEDPEIRNEIRSELESREFPEPRSDVDMLTRFVDLFQVTDSQLNLTKEDRQAMDVRRQQNPPHPFIEFLDLFPHDKLANPPSSSTTWPQLCQTQLVPLANHFRGAIEQENVSGLDLEEMNPQEIVQGLRNRLSYKDFYDKWREVNGLSNEDPYVERWQDPVNEAWQAKLRIYLQSMD